MFDLFQKERKTTGQLKKYRQKKNVISGLFLQQSEDYKYNVLNPIFISGNTHNSMIQVSTITCLVLMTSKIIAVIVNTINTTNPSWVFQVFSNWGPPRTSSQLKLSSKRQVLH